MNVTKDTFTPDELAEIDAECREHTDNLNQMAEEAWEVGALLASTSNVKGFTFGDLTQVQFPQRFTLLARGETPILRAGQLAQLYAVRGVGKTWLTRTLAIVMASGGEALGFNAPVPSRVLYIDGEMASEDIQKRDRLLANTLDLPEHWPSHNLVTVARDWQAEVLPLLDSPEGQVAIEPMVEWADLIVVDNRACLFNPEGEKDSAAWQPAQDWLLSLRRRGKAVLLIHHSNRQGGARGLGRAEDALDLVIKLDRPERYSPEEGARFVLSYDKTRGIPGGDALRPFIAALRPEGWVCEGSGSEGNDHRAKRKMLELIRDASRRGEPIQTKTEASRSVGVQKQAAMQAWDTLLNEGVIEWRDDPEGYHPTSD